MNLNQLNDHQFANRVRWVKDLLSGEFEQGGGLLMYIGSDDGHAKYCCLGVACKRVAPEANLAVTFMDNSVAKVEFGLTFDDQNVASRWNDQQRASFARIADYIAYATVNDLWLMDVPSDVPEGYATGWLETL